MTKLASLMMTGPSDNTHNGIEPAKGGGSGVEVVL